MVFLVREVSRENPHFSVAGSLISWILSIRPTAVSRCIWILSISSANFISARVTQMQSYEAGVALPSAHL